MSKNFSLILFWYFIDWFYYMYEEVIYVCYKLYEEIQDVEYFEDVFRVVGCGKVIYVWEVVQNVVIE